MLKRREEAANPTIVDREGKKKKLNDDRIVVTKMLQYENSPAKKLKMEKMQKPESKKVKEHVDIYAQLWELIETKE